MVNFYSGALVLYALLNVYVLYYFYRSFFEINVTSRYTELGSYLFVFLLNLVVSLWINIPMVTLVVNAVAYYLLTYNYCSDQKHRIFLPLLYLCIVALTESFVVFLSTHTSIQITGENDYNSILGPIFSSVFLYVVVKIICDLKSSTTQIKLPFIHWILLLVIPLASFYLMLIIMNFEESDTKTVAVCCGLALMINFVAFYFYEVVVAYAVNRMEKQREEEKNRYYLRQLETMEAFYESMRSFRHDLKNHAIAMKALLAKGQYDELASYFSGTFLEKALSDEGIHCGNTIIDSILNFKKQEAVSKGISLETELSVPSALHLPDSDLAVILGNLLDNAVEAAEKLRENRVIQVVLSYQKGCLCISVKNPYEGMILKSGDRILTTKKDKENHGYGLGSVKNIVAKNGGTMRIDEKNQRFSVDVMLFDEESPVVS